MAEKPLVGNASNTHLNLVKSPSAEASLVERNSGLPRINSIILYLPKNFNIDAFLRLNPPPRGLKRDKFVYILDLIYSLPSKKKKSIANYSGFTPINKVILGSVIKNYRAYINYLKENDIVEENNYQKGVVSSGLRFTERYRSPINPVEITDWTLIKNITYFRNNYNKEITNQLEFLNDWFYSELTINIEGATRYLMEQYFEDLKNPEIKYPLLRLNSRLYPIEKLYRDEKKLFFIDLTAGRLHTYLTQIKSELRKFIKFKNKKLCAIDISNSQPYLLQALLDKKAYIRNKMEDRIIHADPCLDLDNPITIMLGVLIEKIQDKEDVIKFKQIVSSGKFYEDFGKILKENGEIDLTDDAEIRAATKEITFSTLFSKNIMSRFLKPIRIFKKCFPNVYEVIKFVKKRHHPTLAIILQNLEADLVLHRICREIHLENPEIPLYTLHDSIITTEDYTEYVADKMSRILKNFVGAEPVLKIEKWE